MRGSPSTPRRPASAVRSSTIGVLLAAVLMFGLLPPAAASVDLDGSIADVEAPAERDEGVEERLQGVRELPRDARQADFVEIAESDDISSVWTERTLDLEPWAGEEACLAFVFEAVGTTLQNWNVDDIVVSDADGIVLEEDFTPEAFPPPGWTTWDLGDDPGNQSWGRTTANPNSPPGTARHLGPFAGEVYDGWMVTESVSLGDDPELSYFDRHGFPGNYTYSGVWISTGSCDPRNDPELTTDAPFWMTTEPDQVVTELASVTNTGVGTLEWEITAAGEGCADVADVGWLDLEPLSGALGQDESQDIEVTVDTAGLDRTTLDASLCMITNAPDAEATEFRIKVGVFSQPRIELGLDELSASVVSGETDQDQLSITNVGSDDLEWTLSGERLPVHLDNGPLVTAPGMAPDGADWSELQDASLGHTTHGFGVDAASGVFRIASPFTVEGPGAWDIETLTFHGYIPNSGTQSFFDRVTYRIWDGPPNADDSTVLEGDTQTDRLLDSSFSGIYQALESAPQTTRPIMEIVADGGFTLEEGDYWIDWSLDSGPGAPDVARQPFVTVPFQAETGVGLGMTFSNSWTTLRDLVTNDPQAAPFEITGRLVDGDIGCVMPADVDWLDIDVTSDVLAPGADSELTMTYDATDLAVGTVEVLLCVESNDPDRPADQIPVTLEVLEAEEELTEVVVTPADVTVEVGQDQELTATAVYADGASADVTSDASWISESTAVAGVDADGVVTGVAEGVVEVTATFGGESGAATVTVVADDDDDAGDDDGDDDGVDPGEPLPEGVVRVSGSNRFETAINISQATFGDGEAGSVVLARADDFADSLAGTPLAVDRDAPVLLTVTDLLIDVVADEITRVLPAGGTVYLLGGTAALDASVEADLLGLGYTPVRLAGPERIATSLAVAAELGSVDDILITNGFNFPDALAAGAAAAEVDGVVVLTTPDAADPQIDAFLAANPTATATAVGGPAARAYPDATPVFGPTRETTAMAIADAFFDSPLAIAIARQDDFADALAGGAHIGRLGGPLLLTPDVVLHPDTEAYLCANAESITTGFVYGGTAAVSDEVVGLITARIDGACG